MIKFLLSLFTILAVNISFSQFNEDAPWIKELKNNISESEFQQRNKKQPFSFFEIQHSFNEYWETRNPNKKGSGFKPFKRWEFMVENELDAQGYLPTAKTVLAAWTTKSQMQEASRTAMGDESNWSAIGPFTTTGTGSWSTGQARINVVMIDPNNAVNGTQNWYVGAPAGGIWKSTDAGATWNPMSDNLPQIGVSGIAIDHNDSNIIYIATGDDDGGDTSSVGVWKSTNGGLDWSETDLGPNGTNGTPTSMNDIYTHPTISGIVWVATNNGIYKTINGGSSWTNTQNGNFNDIKLNPANPDIIYAVTSNKFYKSTNGGDSFSLVSAGLPFSSGRLVIDVTPANSNYVYVFRESSEVVSIYRSTNNGTSFSARTTSISEGDTQFSAGQAWFDLAMGVSSTDPEEVYIGCLNVWKSSNGGTSFSKLNNWSSPNSAAYTHADIHFLRDYNGTMFCGSDGGIYATSDGGTNFTDYTSGIQAGQFYRIAVAKTNANKMVGGLQDNGGQAFNNGNGNWQNYYGADGMDTAVDPTDENKIYGFIQFGGGPYISSNTGANLGAALSSPEQGNWVTPMAINSTGKVYGGYSSLYRLDGSSWTPLASFGQNCDLLEIAPSDDTVIYAVINNVLKRSDDSGVSFNNVGSSRPSNIKGVGVHQTNPNIVWLTTSGNSRKIYKTTNANLGAAATYTDVSANLSGIDQSFNDIVHQGNHGDNPVFVATSLGVYRLDDTASNWETFVQNLPNTIVNDLEINLIDESITAATYGRGIWRSPIPIQKAPNDLQLLSINNPTSAIINCGDFNSDITVKNNGLNTINQVDIDYQIDGVLNSFTWNGTIIANEQTTIPLPITSLGLGNHSLQINTSTPGETYLSDNELVRNFLSNETETTTNINTFESTTDLLLSDNAIWEMGIPSNTLLNETSSGTQVYGTDLNANYPDGTKAHLISKCYNLAQLANPVMRFQMAFDLEANWDVFYVEYSLNQGENWNVLGTINSLPLWYNSDRTNASSGGADCYNCPGAQWTGLGEDMHPASGTNATMREYAYDFSTNAGNGETDLTGATNIMFRLVFHSDGGVNEEGVIIDDFVIDGVLGLDDINYNEFSIYPNPSKGIFNIVFNTEIDAIKFNVYDVLGKNVYSKSNKEYANNYVLNLSNLSKGVYFLKIDQNNKSVTKKLVIN